MQQPLIPETDQERLVRLQQTAERHAAKSGPHARRAERHYRALARNLKKSLAYRAEHPS